MTPETVGAALKRWRTLRGLSLRKLGGLVKYDHTYLWEIEKGRKDPQPEIMARCDAELGAGGQLIALAATMRRPDVDPNTDLGLSLGSTWTECINTVTTLWKHDSGRRALLKGAVFVPTAATAPLTWWLDYQGEAADTVAGGRPGVDQSVERLREMIRLFRKHDNLYGGSQIRPFVVQFLDAEVAPFLRANAPESLGCDYLSAVAELTQLAGWLAYDALDHGVGQRYFIQSLQLARWANDRPLGAEILAGMSHQAIFLKQPKRAAVLADAAGKTAERARVPALAAEASLMKAHAQALQQRKADCLESLTAAENLIGQASREDDPQFIGYFDEAYVAAIAGHCFRALGEGERAEQSALRSLNMDNSYLRGRLFNQLLLAGSYVLKADIEQACAVGMRALDIAEDVSSARALIFTTQLVDDLRPWCNRREVKDFTERARLISL